MKLPLPRRQQLTNAIEEITSERIIASNPLLASFVYEHKFIVKFTELANFHTFMSVSATDSEILSKFSYFPQKDFTISENNEIRYKFSFKPNLKICSILRREDREELQAFAGRITNSDIKVQFHKDQGTFTLIFSDYKHLFAFWRALTYVPFHNKYLTASIITVKQNEPHGSKYCPPMHQATTPTIHTSPFKVQRKTNQTITFQIGKRISVPNPTQAQDF